MHKYVKWVLKRRLELDIKWYYTPESMGQETIKPEIFAFNILDSSSKHMH